MPHQAAGGVDGVNALELENNLAVWHGRGVGNRVSMAADVQKPFGVEPVGNVAHYTDPNSTGDAVGADDTTDDYVGVVGIGFRHLA